MNRTKCSLACKTSALESLQRTSKRSLIRSTPPNRKGWEWDWLSAGRLLRIMVESYGPRRMTVPEQHFNLRFQRTSRGINAGPRYLSLLSLHPLKERVRLGSAKVDISTTLPICSRLRSRLLCENL